MKKKKLWWLVQAYTNGVLTREYYIRGHKEAKQTAKKCKSEGFIVDISQSDYIEDDR